MRILICGGHLTPALAVIDSLPKDTDVLYVGRKYGLEGDNALSLEYKIISERKIPFAHINAGKLQRKLTKHTLASLLKLPKGLFEAVQILHQFKPDIVCGFGGYVSVPLGIAANFLNIPLIIHEQTLTCGLANKILASFATKVCISWKTSLDYFPKRKTIVTGNPAVAAIFHNIEGIQTKKKNTFPSLVIVGGSLGSHAINRLVEGSLEKLLENFSVVHQTGDAKEFADFDRLSEKRNALPSALKERYIITKFVDPKDIIAVLYSADLVVTRAGMNTITSLLILNKPSLVIPLPSSGKNDQHKNAQFFQSHGLGVAIDQDSLKPEGFFERISDMMNKREQYTNKKSVEELRIHETATQKIIEIIFSCQKKESYKKESPQSAL